MQLRFTPRCVHFMATSVFTRPAIHVWCSKFARSRESIVDKERSGQHVVATIDATIAAVDAFVRSNQHVLISDIVQHTRHFTGFSAQNRPQSSQVLEAVCSMGAKTAEARTAGHANDDIPWVSE